jgi:TetR/AcrR family tetracycline transcriptional repressor
MVVAAALQLLDEVGFSGLTLRRLADRLKVKAAALYWHFENKQDLIDALAERIMMSEFEHAQIPSIAWRDLLMEVARTHRRALMRYRDGAEVMAHANIKQSNMLAGMERLLSELQGQGFTPELAWCSFFTLVRYTIGCVFEEQADPRTAINDPEERAARFRRIADSYPTFAQGISAVMHGKDRGPEYLFERGVNVILSGVAAQLDNKPA